MGNILLEGGANLLELAARGGGVLIDEAIKLMIFLSVLSILKTASVFILLFVINKYLTFLNESDKNLTIYVKFGKTVGLVISIMYFVTHSIPAFVDLGKVVVAPNLYLIEKGIKLVKGNTK